MRFENIGKEMFCELFGLLVGLDGQWRAQGATKEELSLDAFGFDSVKMADVGCNIGAITGLKTQVLEDNELYRITIDYMGRKDKLIKQSATLPLPLDYPVKTMDDWQKIKHWYTFREDRVDKERLVRLKELQDQGHLITAWIPGGFDEPRQLMGEENLCLAYYDEPEMITDMLTTISDTALKVFERVTEVVRVDNLSVHEDMAGKSGSLVGPSLISKFIAPYYRRVWDELHRQGCTLFSQDSDGNMNSVIDAFLDAGINVMYTCEPAAGMDIVALRKKHGNRVAFKGGIDKHVLRESKEDIRRELTYKMSSVTKGGGMVFALDSRIPNGTPLENYRYYVELSKELLGIPKGVDSPFVRMAF